MILNATSREEFQIQFEKILNSENAKSIKGIIYIWKTNKPICRVKGSNPIIYIGQTARTFHDRYCNSKSFEIEMIYFKRYYQHMIQQYGDISIEIIQTNNPKKSEWEELMKYNNAHKEYPPLNRTIPSKPNT